MAFQELSGTATVTVVDDEPAALDIIVRAAQSWRYECQAATSAASRAWACACRTASAKQRSTALAPFAVPRRTQSSKVARATPAASAATCG